MFVRGKPLGENRTKVQIVTSIRDGARVRQRVVRHVGTATSEAQLDQLMSLGRLIIEEITAEESRQPALFSPGQFHDLLDQVPAARTAGTGPDPFGVDLADCREDHRAGIGVRQAFGAVYDRLGWEGLFGSRRGSASRMIREMVLARVARPQSKRAMVARLRQEGVLALNLDSVYRSMDAITDARVDAICALSRERARTLLPDPITVVFYDTTTPYFESERENGLRFKGYSKDGKPHRVQVVLALLITPEGLPVGYGLFPGNLYEGHTLVKALAALERRHPETRFTLVADAGMLSRANRQALRDRGTPYILGARLKACPKALRARILDVAAYAAWGRSEYADSVAAIRDLPLEDGGRLVVTHSPRRARKDARDRARRLEKLRRKLDRGATPAAPVASATARFLDFPEGRVTINEDRIAAAASWDGLRGIVAWGCDAEDPRDLIGQYRRLAEIGACFRTNRHDLRIRPVFHWQDRRIRAHIAICYMAFCCVRHLRYRLAARGVPLSPARIQDAPDALQVSLLHETNGTRRFGLPSRATQDAQTIYRTLGLTWNTAPFLYTPPRKPHRTSRRTQGKTKP